MRRSGLFKVAALLACPSALAGAHRDRRPVPFVKRASATRIFEGTAPAAPRLRVNAHGPVTLSGGAAGQSLLRSERQRAARTEAAARRLLQRYDVRVEPQGGWPSSPRPADRSCRTVTVEAPALSAGRRFHLGRRGAGHRSRWRPGCRYRRRRTHRSTASPAIASSSPAAAISKVGTVGGGLHCTTGAGRIQRRSSVRGRPFSKPTAAISWPGSRRHRARRNRRRRHPHRQAPAARSRLSRAADRSWSRRPAAWSPLRNLAGPYRSARPPACAANRAAAASASAVSPAPMRVSTSMGNIVANLLGSTPGRFLPGHRQW